MEIVKALLSFILGDRAENLAPLLDALKENSFDLMKFLNNVDPEKIAPVFSELFGEKVPAADFNAPPPEKLSAIEKIADEKIVATLNAYFESDTI